MVHTTASKVGEALHNEGIIIYLGDLVQPSLDTAVSTGLHVYIKRSTPIVIHLDGKTLRTRTRQQTVGDALAEQRIAVMGLDRVVPAMSEIRVTRVWERVEIKQDVIGYERIFSPDDDLEIDRQRVNVKGAAGITNWRYRLLFEDGQMVNRKLEDVWVAQEPITEVVGYGRKLISRDLSTPEGTVSYWRKIRMLATSYSASTAGVSPDAPYYGRTRLGMTMRKGIVAVDPSVIPLGSRVYVEGYGIGFAGDTGSAIIGRRIDLGYDDDNLVSWYQWVDVYVLDPPPPPHQIRWILPNWPRER